MSLHVLRIRWGTSSLYIHTSATGFESIRRRLELGPMEHNNLLPQSSAIALVKDNVGPLSLKAITSPRVGDVR
jgi:hypothetical protein